MIFTNKTKKLHFRLAILILLAALSANEAISQINKLVDNSELVYINDYEKELISEYFTKGETEYLSLMLSANNELTESDFDRITEEVRILKTLSKSYKNTGVCTCHIR